MLQQQPYNNDRNLVADEVLRNMEWITERHIACILTLDTSGSMQTNDAIGKLNQGIQVFKQQTIENTTFDEHASACIDVAIISFGPTVRIQQDFLPISRMTVPQLYADGGTPMGEALNLAMDMATAQKARYNQTGTPYYRPWIFCITDGEPTDDYAPAAERLHEMENRKGILGYCVGVENFKVQRMSTIFDQKRIFRLENLNFPALFEFLSNSMVSIRNDGNVAGGSRNMAAPSDLHAINMDY